jgi:hypothetical protein
MLNIIPWTLDSIVLLGYSIFLILSFMLFPDLSLFPYVHHLMGEDVRPLKVIYE